MMTEIKNSAINASATSIKIILTVPDRPEINPKTFQNAGHSPGANEALALAAVCLVSPMLTTGASKQNDHASHDFALLETRQTRSLAHSLSILKEMVTCVDTVSSFTVLVDMGMSRNSTLTVPGRQVDLACKTNSAICRQL